MPRGDLQIRDLRVIMLLANARTKVTTKEISDRLGLPIRTVQRIIEALEAIPLPIKRDPLGMGNGIQLIGGLALKVTLPSNLVEMAALQVALDRMRDTAGGTVLCEALEHYVARAQAQMTSEQRAIAAKFARIYRSRDASPSAAASPIATLVHKAIDEGRVLTIEYVSPNELKPKRRDIEPAGIWITEQRPYVVGYDREKKAMRIFALDRIHGAVISKGEFAPRGDFDVAQYFRGALNAFVGAPVNLELRLDPEAMRRLGAKRPSRSAKLVKRPDGGAVLYCEAPLSDELLSWMVSLGDGVSVSHPPDASAFVREAFLRRANAQPKAPRKKTSASRREKPTALPGPLIRRIKKRES